VVPGRAEAQAMKVFTDMVVMGNSWLIGLAGTVSVYHPVESISLGGFINE
jgi:hypothetical protein